MPVSRRSATTTITRGVLVVLFAVVLAAAFGTRQLVSNQAQKLLQQRTEELGLVINGLTSSVGAGLSQLAEAAKTGPDPAAAFTAATHLSTSVREEALIRSEGEGVFTVLAAAGPDLVAGQSLSRELSSSAAQALHSSSFVVSPVYSVNGRRVAALLSAVGAPSGDLVLQENPVTAEEATATNTTGPYSELFFALYEGRHAVRSQLAEANAPVQTFRGASASEVVHIGASNFLLVTAARTSLVGSVELNAQWVVLGLGLLLMMMLGVLFELAQRRRDFALDLVDQRTAELNLSLDQLRHAQDQLVHRERLAAIGELASAVGHELRNPLAVISNALYLLRRATAAAQDPRIAQNLATADREVSAATLIVSDLLEYSRSREPMMTQVDLGDLVDEVLSVAPHPSSIVVEWEPPSPPVTGTADRDQMRQVFLNLITNAYDAMPNGGSLRIGVSQSTDGTARIDVADDGSGMSVETRSRVFEPFFTTKARGVGLGMAVTNRIVTAHQGSIEVQSEPERGTTFTVLLPTQLNGKVMEGVDERT